MKRETKNTQTKQQDQPGKKDKADQPSNSNSTIDPAALAEQIRKNQDEPKERKRPITRARSGRFQITTWENKRVVSPKKQDRGFSPEKEFVNHRVCVQYSRYNFTTRTYDRQAIWFNSQEIRDLAQALDSHDEQISQVTGDIQSPSSSVVGSESSCEVTE